MASACRSPAACRAFGSSVSLRCNAARLRLQFGEAQRNLDPLRNKDSPRMQLRCEVGGDGKLRLLLQRFLHGLSDDHMGITRVLIVAGIVLYVADAVLLQVKMPDEQCHASRAIVDECLEDAPPAHRG